MDTMREALNRMVAEEPELAVALVLQSLPAAVSGVRGSVRYDLTIEEVGAYRIEIAEGRAQVSPHAEGAPPHDGVDFALTGDAATFVAMAGGESPTRLMLSGRLRIRGKRRRALRLRGLGADGVTMADVARAGGPIDPDLVFRALAYAVDPEWTKGHSFVVAYALTGEPSGTWYVEARDGNPLHITRAPPPAGVDATLHLAGEVYLSLLAGELTPPIALQRGLTRLEGAVHPLALLGRWIERSQGHDDAELERERAQREVQARRRGSWGSAGGGAGAGQGDPAHESEGARRSTGDLLDYGQLYALWETQNWKVHELDFTVDREQWVTMPSETQSHTRWSLGTFYLGEERVTSDLAPFLTAAPSGEVEIFLATQLVDEARHAAFFDRFAAEVMALEAEDLRGRIAELEPTMPGPWRTVFDGGLRDVAGRLRDSPGDLDLFVEGVATYHMVIEGFLAMTGQRMLIDYMAKHSLYPGFVKGFSLVERDEHRHIAFGVRFLKEMMQRDRRYGEIVERTVAALVPKAAFVLVPPYVEDASDFISYDYHSSYVYGYAYRALRRRMSAIGLTTPPAEELMPGPVAELEPAAAA